MTQNDRQRTRRNLGEGGTPAQRARREQARDRERRVEVLVAEVLNILSQRDVVVAGLERRAGRCLTEIHDLGWPGPARAAAACDLSVREAARLCQLGNADEPDDSINRN